MAHQESWNREASDSSSCQQQDGLVLCSNNCGFLGSPATMNLCPNCFRDLSLKKQSLSADQAAKVEKTVVPPKPSPCEDHAEITSPSSAATRSTTAAPTCHCSSIDSSVASSSSSFSSNPSTSVYLQQQQPSSNTASNTASNLNLNASAALTSIAALFSEKDEKKSLTPSRRQSVNRCLTCRKRTGLLGFKCRCGNVFCSTHRYSDKHDCPFDYKAAAREAIAKANPVIKAQKIQKI